MKIPLVTLIDTLDTLVVMGNFSEFRHAVELVTENLLSFNIDVNVSVFEITIRVLGGLLSAHLSSGNQFYCFVFILDSNIIIIMN